MSWRRRPEPRSTGRFRLAVSGPISARGVCRGESGHGRPAARLFCGLSGVPGSGAGVRVAVGGPWRVRTGSGLVRPLRRAGRRPLANRFSHSCSRCQPSGRCRVRWPRPCRAVRAATAIRSRRMVAARAFANGRHGQGPGGAEQVVRHGRDRQPGRVRGERPRTAGEQGGRW